MEVLQLSIFFFITTDFVGSSLLVTDLRHLRNLFQERDSDDEFQPIFSERCGRHTTKLGRESPPRQTVCLKSKISCTLTTYITYNLKEIHDHDEMISRTTSQNSSCSLGVPTLSSIIDIYSAAEQDPQRYLLHGFY